MAGEITVTASVQVRNGDFQYQSTPTYFTANMEGKRRTPGTIRVTPYGVDLDLSVLDNPSFSWAGNDDADNIIEMGIWDPESGKFYPLYEWLPGEVYPFRLSRNVFQEFGAGTGTGSTGPSTNKIRLRSNLSECNFLIDVFDR